MKIHSFDIFDTVLTRKVLYPKDVFHLVQHLIPERLPALPPQLKSSFHGYRVWSEFVARRKTQSDDINIEDIYRELGGALQIGEALRNDLMELELEVESEVLMPMHGIVSLMTSLRKEGGRVVFISDMYLSSWYISQVLEGFNLYQPGDRIYVSGEKGVTKGSGKLFSLVLQEMGIQPHELVHYGDHLHADYIVPKSMGIRILNDTGFKGAPFFFALKKNLVYLKELINARVQISGVLHV